jgi:hypothetical protein
MHDEEGGNGNNRRKFGPQPYLRICQVTPLHCNPAVWWLLLLLSRTIDIRLTPVASNSAVSVCPCTHTVGTITTSTRTSHVWCFCVVDSRALCCACQEQNNTSWCCVCVRVCVCTLHVCLRVSTHEQTIVLRSVLRDNSSKRED